MGRECGWIGSIVRPWGEMRRKVHEMNARKEDTSKVRHPGWWVGELQQKAADAGILSVPI